MTSAEDQLKRSFGEEGLNNLKAHAKSANMSLATFVFMANFNPSELARILLLATKKPEEFKKGKGNG